MPKIVDDFHELLDAIYKRCFPNGPGVSPIAEQHWIDNPTTIREIVRIIINGDEFADDLFMDGFTLMYKWFLNAPAPVPDAAHWSNTKGFAFLIDLIADGHPFADDHTPPNVAVAKVQMKDAKNLRNLFGPGLQKLYQITLNRNADMDAAIGLARDQGLIFLENAILNGEYTARFGVNQFPIGDSSNPDVLVPTSALVATRLTPPPTPNVPPATQSYCVQAFDDDGNFVNQLTIQASSYDEAQAKADAVAEELGGTQGEVAQGPCGPLPLPSPFLTVAGRFKKRSRW